MDIEQGIDFSCLGYKRWKSEREGNGYINHWQKSIESKRVCETNDKLYINLSEFYYNPLDRDFKHKSFTVEIVAEINGKWWTLNCYSLSEEDLKDIETVEQILVKLVNSF